MRNTKSGSSSASTSRKRAAAALSAAGALGLLFGSCLAVVPEPSLEHAGQDPVVLEQLRDGRSLYIRKCSGCHELFAPGDHPPEAWERSLRDMIRARRVKLAEEEGDLILRYLGAVRRAP